MSEKLREQYLAFLAVHGLAPRPLPPDREKLEAAVVGHLVAHSRALGDEFMANLYEETYRGNAEKYRSETRHPATILIESTAEAVERSIQAIERYRKSLTVEVFAGEFPTGSVNAQAVQAEGGFLVLINSGLLVAVKQVAEFLVEGDPDHASDRSANATAVEGVIAVLDAYVRFGDPFFGPKPLSGGLEMFLRHALARAMTAFVVAHEYGHVIAGHFDDRVLHLERLASSPHSIEVVRKDWQQEFEADAIAHKILLGVDDYAKLDLGEIDRAFDPEERRGSVKCRALELKAAIAAPMLFLTIDAILADVQRAVGSATGSVGPDGTHPPARDRMDRIMESVGGFNPKYSGYINFAAILWAHSKEIVARLVRGHSSGVAAAGVPPPASPTVAPSVPAITPPAQASTLDHPASPESGR
jgi:hypothetical protein